MSPLCFSCRMRAQCSSVLSLLISQQVSVCVCVCVCVCGCVCWWACVWVMVRGGGGVCCGVLVCVCLRGIEREGEGKCVCICVCVVSNEACCSWLAVQYSVFPDMPGTG